MENFTTYIYENTLDGKTDFELTKFDKYSIKVSEQSAKYYTVFLITNGSGKVKVDFSEFSFEKQSLIFFLTSQSYLIKSNEKLKGYKILFNSKILSIRNFQEEVPEAKILFSSCYTPLILKLKNQTEVDQFKVIIEYFKHELLAENVSKATILSLNLKVLIKTASYLKLISNNEAQERYANIEIPFKSQYVIDAIDHNFRNHHNVEFYTNLFLIPYDVLNQICLDNFKKSLVDLILERLIIESNRLLYLTIKENKQIADELGFSSEKKFTTFFKTRTGMTPDIFRQTLRNG